MWHGYAALKSSQQDLEPESKIASALRKLSLTRMNRAEAGLRW